MRSTIFALGLYSAAVIHPALAQSIEADATPDDTTSVIMARGEIDNAKEPHFREDKEDRGHHEKAGPEGDKLKIGEHGLELAAQLSAVETQIGIRSEQLDVWRDYTTALQNVLVPPRPEKMADPRENPQAEAHGPKDPFDREQKLADEVINRAQSAEKLNAAIAALRTALTPRQLEELSALNRLD